MSRHIRGETSADQSSFLEAEIPFLRHDDMVHYVQTKDLAGLGQLFMRA